MTKHKKTCSNEIKVSDFSIFNPHLENDLKSKAQILFINFLRNDLSCGLKISTGGSVDTDDVFTSLYQYPAVNSLTRRSSLIWIPKGDDYTKIDSHFRAEQDKVEFPMNCD